MIHLPRKSTTKLPKRKGEFKYRGKTITELKSLSVEEFSKLLPAKERRTITRGLNKDQQEIIRKFNDGAKQVRTHYRNMIILPCMVDNIIEIYNGKEFIKVQVQPEMIGHRFGEFALTRKKITHGGVGVGATRSSKFVPLK